MNSFRFWSLVPVALAVALSTTWVAAHGPYDHVHPLPSERLPVVRALPLPTNPSGWRWDSGRWHRMEELRRQDWEHEQARRRTEIAREEARWAEEHRRRQEELAREERRRIEEWNREEARRAEEARRRAWEAEREVAKFRVPPRYETGDSSNSGATAGEWPRAATERPAVHRQATERPATEPVQETPTPVLEPVRRRAPEVEPEPVASAPARPDPEYPMARIHPTRKNVVFSPFDPEGKDLIDVRGIEPGELAKDPRTGRIFRVPLIATR